MASFLSIFSVCQISIGEVFGFHYVLPAELTSRLTARTILRNFRYQNNFQIGKSFSLFRFDFAFPSAANYSTRSILWKRKIQCLNWGSNPCVQDRKSCGGNRDYYGFIALSICDGFHKAGSIFFVEDRATFQGYHCPVIFSGASIDRSSECCIILFLSVSRKL